MTCKDLYSHQVLIRNQGLGVALGTDGLGLSVAL